MLDFTFDNHVYKLPISKVVEDITTITIATLLYAIPPHQMISAYLSQYGTVTNTEQVKYSDNKFIHWSSHRTYET